MMTLPGQDVVTMLAEDRDTLLLTVANVLGRNRRLELEIERLKRAPSKRELAAAVRGGLL